MNTSGRSRLVAVAGAATLLLLLGACGDDDDGGDDAAATTTAGDDAGEDEADLAGSEYCAEAQELADAGEEADFPTPEQLQRYVELAPDEIADEVAAAVEGLLPAAESGDVPAQYAAFAEDDVTAAIAAIDAFETEHCGIDHSEDGAPEGDEEPAEGATEVEVTATDYAFELPESVAAGATALVLRNDGEEAHFMIVERILQGTLEEALAFEGDADEAGLTEFVGVSGLAAPGGEDTEVANVELEAGNYALLCFVPAADGTPHAYMGMAQAFTVE
jgi:hypothetical protein